MSEMSAPATIFENAITNFRQESGWTQRRLTDLAHYYNGIAFKPADWSQDGLPIIRIEQLNNPNGEFDRYEGPVFEVNRICDGDLVFSWSATLKVVIWRHGDAVLNQHLFKVIPKPGFDIKFIYFLLDYCMDALSNGSHGSTMKHIKRGELDKFVAKVPSLVMQQQIATILTSIDTAIEKTEALIDKYQQIKAGLMHDLFTRGVLPNGQLRPPREQAPELYQETAIGWIPREWEFKRCADICSRICVGIVIQPTQYYVEDGIPAFRSANVREDGIDRNNFVYISAQANLLLAKSQVKAGDIVSVRTGYPGTSAVIPPEFQGANCIDILISTPNEQVSSEYLCDWINSSFGKWQVLRQQGGMAQQHFNVGEMRELLVALPDLGEQERIRSKIKSVSDKLAVEQELSEKLRTEKLGLMQDLLTGKVPVKIDTPATEPADV